MGGGSGDGFSNKSNMFTDFPSETPIKSVREKWLRDNKPGRGSRRSVAI